MDIAKLLSNEAGIVHGMWVKPGPDFGDLEIQTRGVTDEYIDASQRTRGLNEARFAPDPVPNAVARATEVDLFLRHQFLGVRGLTRGTGEEAKAVEDHEFRELLPTVSGRKLWLACRIAVNKVTESDTATERDDAGN